MAGSDHSRPSGGAVVLNRGPRSEVDTAAWRRLVDLCEAHPSGVAIERSVSGAWWHVRVHTRYGVETAMAQEIAPALHCLADNLERRDG